MFLNLQTRLSLFQWQLSRAVFIGLLIGLSLPATANKTQTSIDSTDLSLPSHLTAKDLDWIADKIYLNEANRQAKFLTHWNKGEAFPSFGIGHFIWLFSDNNQPFEATFQAMVDYVSKNHSPPEWLENLAVFEPPWQTRRHFYQAWSSEKLVSLRNWLEATQRQQAEFIYLRFQQALMAKLETLDESLANQLKIKITQLLKSKTGLFLMVDYHNFKGLGFNDKEVYQGVGWGLLNVIQQMSLPDDLSKVNHLNPLRSNVSAENSLAYEKKFVEAAKKTLQKRIELSPPSRHEARWRAGWFKRLEGNLNAY